MIIVIRKDLKFKQFSCIKSGKDKIVTHKALSTKNFVHPILTHSLRFS